jgi:hypothetical protein
LTEDTLLPRTALGIALETPMNAVANRLDVAILPGGLSQMKAVLAATIAPSRDHLFDLDAVGGTASGSPVSTAMGKSSIPQ